MTNEQRVRELGLEIPPVQARGNYVPTKFHAGLLYLAGNGPIRPDGSMIQGIAGDGVSVDQAREAACLTALNILGTARSATGSLDDIDGVVSLTGYVRATPDFTEHPRVLDACSDLLVGVFGAGGPHVRAAVGVASLPFGIVVEVSVILSVEERRR